MLTHFSANPIETPVGVSTFQFQIVKKLILKLLSIFIYIKQKPQNEIFFIFF